MCIAIPAEVVSVDGVSAVVDVYGERFVVSLLAMSEAVEPGDFVALQARYYAVTKIAREEARESRRLLEELFPELVDRARTAGAAAAEAGQ